jgi:hypothetical protein
LTQAAISDAETKLEAVNAELTVRRGEVAATERAHAAAKAAYHQVPS